MAKNFDEIIDTYIITLCKTNEFLMNADKEFLVNKRDAFYKDSLSTLYFLEKFNKKIRRRAKISEIEMKKIKKCLNFLKKGNIFFSAVFLRKIYIVNRKIIRNLFNFKSKTYRTLRDLENTQKYLNFSKKNYILGIIIDSAKTTKLFSFTIKKLQKSLSIDNKKYFYFFVEKLIKLIFHLKILSKISSQKLIHILKISVKKPNKFIKINNKNKKNFSRFFKKRIISKNTAISILELKNEETNEKIFQKEIKKDSFIKSIYEVDSLYYKLEKQHFNKTNLTTNVKLINSINNNNNIKTNFNKKNKNEDGKNNNSPKFNDNPYLINKDLISNNKANTITNYNKYDNSKNPGILFHLLIPLKNYLANNANLELYDEIYREYIDLKCMEIQKPEIILTNLSSFESKILIPLYQKITLCSNKKMHIYNYVFAKYRNILLSIISMETNISFKIEPYGSFSNNFLLDVGDLDMCIIPESDNYLKDFESILDKVNCYLIKNVRILNNL